MTFYDFDDEFRAPNSSEFMGMLYFMKLTCLCA